MEKNNQEIALENYLEVESLLREFFDNVDYCKDNCVKLPIGCCDGNFYSHGHYTDQLEQERIKKHGSPEKKRYCGYHSENGCKLKTHKSPICISYICGGLDEYLKNNFDIDYHYHGVDHFLEGILIRKISKIYPNEPESIDEFKSEINNWIEKVKNEKK